MNKQMRVLMIEDSADDTLLVARNLEHAGYQVALTVAATAEEMQQALASNHFDVILVGYNLPAFSAEDALKVLRKSGEDIPAIIVSGSIGELTAVCLMKQGAKDYLMKNDLTRLAAVIERERHEALSRRQKREAEENMLLAARQWQETFNSISDIVLVLDLNFKIVQANQAARNMLGESNLEGKFCYQLIHHTDQPPDFCLIQRLIENRQPCRTELYAPELGGRWFDLRVFPILDTAGNIVRIVHALRDISDQKKNEAALRETERQLRQAEKLQTVGQLAGGIAHDFNNQLTGIMGYADLLASSLPEERYRAFAQEIVRAAVHAAELTAQLLAFSRKGNFITTAVDIHALIREVLSILRHSIDKRISMECHLNADNPVVIGDHTQIQSALLNICLNSRDAMPDGGTLSFATEVISFCKSDNIPSEISPGKYVQITISDTGTGISPELRNRIFDPFFTTKPIGKGTGLGLAAVYGTVKAHGGTIDFDSCPDCGTTFRIDLPLSDAPLAQVEKNTAPPVRGSGMVLVVDDEASSRDVAAESLRSLGYMVTAFADAREALEFFRTHWEAINIVLLDLMLPNISGKEVFHRMRSIHPQAKILLASGYHIDEEIREMVRESKAGFVQKPYRYHELARLVQNALQP